MESKTMRAVYLESPYANNGTADDVTIARNIRYLRACIRDCLLRGDSPIATHAVFTQPGILHDEIPAERRYGIDAGEPWRKVCEVTVIYTDLTPGVGVVEGEERSRKLGHRVEIRQLGGNWEQDYNERVSTGRSRKIWASVDEV